MTPEELAKLDELIAAAAPGPWEFDATGCCYSDTPCNPAVIEPFDQNEILVDEEDATFIVTARTALPKLLAYVRELEGVIAGASTLMKNLAKTQRGKADKMLAEGYDHPDDREAIGEMLSEACTYEECARMLEKST